MLKLRCMNHSYSIVLVSVRRTTRLKIAKAIGDSKAIVCVSQAADLVNHFRQYGHQTRAVLVDVCRADSTLRRVVSQLPILVWPFMPPLVVLEGQLVNSFPTISLPSGVAVMDVLGPAMERYVANQKQITRTMPVTIIATVLERSSILLMHYLQWFQSMRQYPISKQWLRTQARPVLSGGSLGDYPTAFLKSMVSIFEHETGIFLPPPKPAKRHALVNPTAETFLAYVASVSEPSTVVLRVPAVTDDLVAGVAQVHRRLVVGYAPWDIIVISESRVRPQHAIRQSGVPVCFDRPVSADQLSAVTQYLALARYCSDVLPKLLNQLKSQWLPFRFRRNLFLDKVSKGELVSVSMVQNLFPELEVTAEDLAKFDQQAPDDSLFALIQKKPLAVVSV